MTHFLQTPLPERLKFMIRKMLSSFRINILILFDKFTSSSKFSYNDNHDEVDYDDDFDDVNDDDDNNGYIDLVSHVCIEGSNGNQNHCIGTSRDLSVIFIIRAGEITMMTLSRILTKVTMMIGIGNLRNFMKSTEVTSPVLDESTVITF